MPSRLKVIDGCYSLKLECALRGLGFVDLQDIVVAHAGIYFIRPISFQWNCSPDDDLIGFQMRRPSEKELNVANLHLGWPTLPSAKSAIELALSLS